MKKFINKIKNNKVLSVLSVLIIGLFFILVTRITYAYLAPVINDAQTNVVGSSDTVDDFKFELGDPLKIDATPTTLKENGDNYVTVTNANVLLKANSTKKTATYNYYIYLQIASNTFTYSDGSTPEIILSITNPNGEEITSIDGLTYGTFNGVSGFDVTTKNGLFNIANAYEITSNSSTEYTLQEWYIALIYINLPVDQSSNFGNSMKANVHITKNEQKPTLAEYVMSQYTGTQGENGIYYHNSSLANGAGDNSYRYAGGDYKLTDKALSEGYTTISSYDGDYPLIKNDNYNKLAYNPSDTGTIALIEAIEQAITDGYIESGGINNFVCFGTNESPCPTDNLYIIIGVINGRVKLIKYDYASGNLLGTNGTYAKSIDLRDTGFENIYVGKLNTIDVYDWLEGSTEQNAFINTNLNENFVNNTEMKWLDKIFETTWNVGLNSSTDITKLYNVTASAAYQNETKNITFSSIVEAKVGLVAASEVGFSYKPENWTYNLIDDNNRNSAGFKSWLTLGYQEACSMVGGVILRAGVIGLRPDYVAARPTFYLNHDVIYVSGTGTQSDPIIID